MNENVLIGKHPFFNFPFGRLKGSEFVELHHSLNSLITGTNPVTLCADNHPVTALIRHETG
ncbi:hypothetical protein QUF80_18475 [Desulfococcaceae bacterium HSG8]|nr:hypothetical protein [Desulfococcaceae bacterium HSG8]